MKRHPLLLARLAAVLALAKVASAEDWLGPPSIDQYQKYTKALAIGDINEDAAIDYVVGLGTASDATREAVLRVNDGSGHFSTLATLPNGGGDWLSVALGDFNGDGATDLFGSRTPAVVWYATADHQFPGPPSLLPGALSGRSYGYVAVADLDGDDCDDLVLGPAEWPSSYIYIGFGGPTGIQSGALVFLVNIVDTFGCEPEDYPTYLSGFTTQDMDGDEDPDIVLTAEFRKDAGCGQNRKGIGWIENLGGKQFSSEVQWAMRVGCAYGQGYYSPLAFGDVNSDGRTDIVYSDYQLRPFALFGGLGGTWIDGGVISSTTGAPLVFDADRDGSLDLVLTTVARIHALRGDGLGHFELVQTINSNQGHRFAVEMTGDDRPDLLVDDHVHWQIKLFPSIAMGPAAVDGPLATRSELEVQPSILNGGGAVRILGAAGAENVAVTDLSGRVIRLLRLEPQGSRFAGIWDGTDTRGVAVGAGVYWLSGGSGAGTAQRVVVVR